MRKILNQLGLEPWDFEMIALRDERGMSEHEAKNHVIMRWMKAGDARPLLAAIKEDKILRAPILGLLARMLESGELAFKKKGRGRRPDPEADVRNEFAADVYEDVQKDEEIQKAQVKSDDLFRAVGSAVGRSEESVRQAWTNRHKSKPARSS